MIAPVHPNVQFEPGQLIQHRHYGYRGVVVAVDDICRAPEDWYQNNQTQPLREQPWYHVLVHQTETTTYAAQTSLISDAVSEAVDHPLIEHFFTHFDGTRYHRNDRVWQGW